MTFRVEEQDGEEISFLGFDDLEFCHEQALLAYPEHRRGMLSRGGLEGALHRPVAHHLYEGECDIVRLAALLWHAVSMAHGYEDGNKRTAFLLMTVFLEVNGVELVEDSAYPGHFINRCFDCGDFTVETLDTFLRSRCRWVAGS